jgi:hypothetical protein
MLNTRSGSRIPNTTTGLTITTPQPDDRNRSQTPSDVRPPTTDDIVGLGSPFPNAPRICADMGGPDTVSGFSGLYWGDARLISGQWLGTMWAMESQIHSVAIRAGGFLMNPLVWATMAASLLALMTGLAARVVVFVEDLRTTRIRGSNKPRHRSTSRPSPDRDSRPRVSLWAGRCRRPRPLDNRCLRVPWPRRRRDAQEPQRPRPGAAVLKRSTDRNVDRDTRLQNGHFFPTLVPTPNIRPTEQHMPELSAHSRQHA